MPEEERPQHAIQAVREGNYTLRQAERDWNVDYSKLQPRIQGGHSRAENGGNNSKLNTVEELALFGWINTRLLKWKRVFYGSSALTGRQQHRIRVDSGCDRCNHV
jgi:hypothetical protein